jgi:succinate-acetate transporter protein
MADTEAAPARTSLIGNPVCVGVGGFGISTTALGLYSIGVFDPKGTAIVLILAMIYGGIVQAVAGFFALAKGETFGACFMTAYGAFWITYVGLIKWAVPMMGTAAGTGVAIYLIMWTITTFGFMIATMNVNKVVFGTFIEFVCTLVLLDIGAAGGPAIATTIGGYFVIILGLLGWYIVYAELVNEMSGRAVFPMGEFKNGPLLARKSPSPADPDFS